MISINKSELTRATIKVTALKAECDEIFKSILENNGIEETSVEADYLFDLIFNGIDYSNRPAFRQLIEIVGE